MRRVCITKTRKKLFITINMTIIVLLVDNNVQQWWCNDGMMGTVQPSRQIRRCQCQVDARMCVGVKGRQRGKGGRARRWCIFAHAHHAIGVREFFWQHDVGGSTHNNSYEKYGAHMMLRSVYTNSRALNTMVPSELTGGVNIGGLLVFLRFWN